MIQRVGYQTWREVPISVLLELLGRLRAGVVYCPQHLPDPLMNLAFVTQRADDQLVSAVEGLELAIAIADDLGLDYSIYSHEQTTIQGIRSAAFRQMSRQRIRAFGIERRFRC